MRQGFGPLLSVLAVGMLACQGIAAANVKFQRVISVVLENTSYDEALGLPYLSQLARQGAVLSNFMAVAHPSQPNYIALVSGSTQGVISDRPVDLKVRHIGDLLEDKGLEWRVYAEQFPGNCYLGATSGNYVRKHVPFLSFVNVQSSPSRCAKVINSAAFDRDFSSGQLPQYIMYVPDMKNDGHNTSAEYADRWLSQRFGPVLSNAKFMANTIFILTFDESDNKRLPNRVFTLIFGGPIKSGVVNSSALNHYSLLRMIEDNFGLNHLGVEDSNANVIDGIWN